MSRPITLAGFERTFAADPHPWRTFRARDEAHKRAAILHALGPRPLGRVLELASGNGSNSAALAARALRLDATEGTLTGTRLTAEAVNQYPRARASPLVLPGRFPARVYDVIVVAELLYYLDVHQMRRVARDVAASLRRGGTLVLAHHRIDFHDFAQHAAGIHARFLAATRVRWQKRASSCTGRWRVAAFRSACYRPPASS